MPISQTVILDKIIRYCDLRIAGYQQRADLSAEQCNQEINKLEQLKQDLDKDRCHAFALLYCYFALEAALARGYQKQAYQERLWEWLNAVEKWDKKLTLRQADWKQQGDIQLILEKLVNHLMLLQRPLEIFHHGYQERQLLAIEQSDADCIIEYYIAGAFDKSILVALLSEIADSRRSYLIDNNRHACAIRYENSKFYFYDPNNLERSDAEQGYSVEAMAALLLDRLGIELSVSAVKFGMQEAKVYPNPLRFFPHYFSYVNRRSAFNGTLFLSRAHQVLLMGDNAWCDALLEQGGFLGIIEYPSFLAKNLTITKRLLQAGLEVEGRGALHYAVQANNKALLDLLLNFGLDPRERDLDEKTALHRACELRHFDCIEYLVRAGAGLYEKDAEGKTPLDYCAPADKEWVAALSSEGYDQAYYTFLKKLQYEDLADEDLASAAFKRFCNQMTSQVGKPLFWLIRRHINIKKLIAFFSSDLTQLDEFGNSVLHVAVLSGNEEAMHALSSRVSLTVTNVKGETAFDLLIKGNDVKEGALKICPHARKAELANLFTTTVFSRQDNLGLLLFNNLSYLYEFEGEVSLHKMIALGDCALKNYLSHCDNLSEAEQALLITHKTWLQHYVESGNYFSREITLKQLLLIAAANEQAGAVYYLQQMLLQKQAAAVDSEMMAIANISLMDDWQVELSSYDKLVQQRYFQVAVALDDEEINVMFADFDLLKAYVESPTANAGILKNLLAQALVFYQANYVDYLLTQSFDKTGNVVVNQEIYQLEELVKEYQESNASFARSPVVGREGKKCKFEEMDDAVDDARQSTSPKQRRTRLRH